MFARQDEPVYEELAGRRFARRPAMCRPRQQTFACVVLDDGLVWLRDGTVGRDVLAEDGVELLDAPRQGPRRDHVRVYPSDSAFEGLLFGQFVASDRRDEHASHTTELRPACHVSVATFVDRVQQVQNPKFPLHAIGGGGLRLAFYGLTSQRGHLSDRVCDMLWGVRSVLHSFTDFDQRHLAVLAMDGASDADRLVGPTVRISVRADAELRVAPDFCSQFVSD